MGSTERGDLAAVVVGAAGTDRDGRGNYSDPGQYGPPGHHVLNIGVAADALEIQKNTHLAPRLTRQWFDHGAPDSAMTDSVPSPYSSRVGVVPPHLRSSVNLLLRTFPSGVPEEEYAALLVALDEKYSEEALGIVVGEVTGFDPLVVINDHAKAMSRQRPNPLTVHDVWTKLRRNGLDELQ